MFFYIKGLIFITSIILCSILNKESFAFGDLNSLPASKTLRESTGLPVSQVPEVFKGVSIKENLGKKIDLQTFFINQNGDKITIEDMLKDGKPLLLTLNYFRCTTLCTLQLANFAKSLKELGWPIGKNFKIATISFDPTDTPAVAKEKNAEYVTLTEQNNPDWKFYVGDEENILKLTNDLGFYYKYDKVSNEFAHAAAIFFISPNGKISRYLYGITYPPLDIKFSLMDASENKIGSPMEQVLLTCFHYNPTTGKYDAFAIGLLRFGASFILVLLVFVLGYFFWREKRKAY